MNKSVIIDAVRSPIGVRGGNLIGVRPDELAAQVISGLLERNKNLDQHLIEDMIFGCAFPEGPQGMLISRGIGILAGLPNSVSGSVVNRFCGSSMDAVHQVSTKIESGDIEIGIAGGVEDMFSVPMGGFSPDLNPRLAALDYYISMGETAERLAFDGKISRTEQEEFSIKSHEKAINAMSKNKFENEIIPIKSDNLKTTLEDEGPREPNLVKIKSLTPVFNKNGSITAATSSPVSMGASAVLLTSETFAKKHKLTIRAHVIGRAVAGVDWRKMGVGPLPATKKALKQANLKMDDIDLIELNEAFAAQALYVIKAGNWDQSKINSNGGSIALGHPLGCSGARIIATLINTLEQKNQKTGLATMCIGTGQGISTIIKRA
jgi:acetyl-CoA acetyltransferase family protein